MRSPDNQLEKRNIKKKLYVKIFLILLVLIFAGGFYMYNTQAVKKTVKAAYNKTVLFLLGKEMELPETAPVVFDQNRLVKEGRRNWNEKEKKVDYYYNHYEDYQDLKERTGFILPESDSLQFNSTFMVYMYLEKRTGSFNTVLQYDSHNYNLRGVFKIVDYTQNGTKIDFGQGKWATSIYKYGDGKEVFFIRNWGYDEYLVYFEAGNVLYELTVPNTEEDVAAAKEIVEKMEE